MSSPFNSYDDKGFRETITGCKSSKIEDEAIIRNLRFAFKEKIAHLSDTELVNEYDQFALSDMFGDNDERFIEWLTK